MLQNSFIQLPGVGIKKEKSMWKNGVLNWLDFINLNENDCNENNMSKYIPNIKTYLNKLDNRDIIYFYNILPSSESWRLFGEFQNDCLFLDIETNGGDSFSGYITTIDTFGLNKYLIVSLLKSTKNIKTISVLQNYPCHGKIRG